MEYNVDKDKIYKKIEEAKALLDEVCEHMEEGKESKSKDKKYKKDSEVDGDKAVKIISLSLGRK
jgi:hypothetical protein